MFKTSTSDSEQVYSAPEAKIISIASQPLMQGASKNPPEEEDI